MNGECETFIFRAEIKYELQSENITNVPGIVLVVVFFSLFVRLFKKKKKSGKNEWT